MPRIHNGVQPFSTKYPWLWNAISQFSHGFSFVFELQDYVLSPLDITSSFSNLPDVFLYVLQRVRVERYNSYWFPEFIHGLQHVFRADRTHIAKLLRNHQIWTRLLEVLQSYLVESFAVLGKLGD
jgi:hypothetical protein